MVGLDNQKSIRKYEKCRRKGNGSLYSSSRDAGCFKKDYAQIPKSEDIGKPVSSPRMEYSAARVGRYVISSRNSSSGSPYSSSDSSDGAKHFGMDGSQNGAKSGSLWQVESSRICTWRYGAGSGSGVISRWWTDAGDEGGESEDVERAGVDGHESAHEYELELEDELEVAYEEERSVVGVEDARVDVDVDGRGGEGNFVQILKNFSNSSSSSDLEMPCFSRK